MKKNLSTLAATFVALSFSAVVFAADIFNTAVKAATTIAKPSSEVKVEKKEVNKVKKTKKTKKEKAPKTNDKCLGEACE